MNKKNTWCCVCGADLEDNDILDNLFPYHIEYCRHRSCNKIFKILWESFDELSYYMIRVSYLENKFLG